MNCKTLEKKYISKNFSPSRNMDAEKEKGKRAYMYVRQKTKWTAKKRKKLERKEKKGTSE